MRPLGSNLHFPKCFGISKIFKDIFGLASLALMIAMALGHFLHHTVNTELSSSTRTYQNLLLAPTGAPSTSDQLDVWMQRNKQKSGHTKQINLYTCLAQLNASNKVFLSMRAATLHFLMLVILPRSFLFKCEYMSHGWFVSNDFTFYCNHANGHFQLQSH